MFSTHLALAKDCYAMGLELLTNVTVIDDAIGVVTSHAATIEKANSDKMPIADEIRDIRYQMI